MPYVLTLTQAGLTAVVNYHAGSVGEVALAQIGLTNTQFTVSSTLTALPGEFKRLDVGGDTLGDAIVHVEALDTSSDAYGYCGFGLFTSDGILFAVYGQTDTIAEKTADTASYIVLDVAVTQSQASAIIFGDTNFLNPPATTDNQGVVELATVEEAQAGIDALRALTPAAAVAAVMGWILARDGAGSGLDAELLVGQPASYYTDIAARLGYTPVQQGGGAGQQGNKLYLGWADGRLKTQVDTTDLGNLVTDANAAGSILTFSGSLMRRNGLDLWGPDNDGAGSGLDAGLLAGQLPAWYTDITGRLGFTPVQQGGGAGQQTNKVYLGWSGSRIKCQIDSADQGNVMTDGFASAGTLTFNGALMRRGGLDLWGSDNDGAGSGLDADLLRGLHWHSGQDVGFGQVDASTPVSGGTTGGIRLRGNSEGNAFFQITDSAAAGQWGYWSHTSAGEANWSGAAGLRANGATVWTAANDGAGSGNDADLWRGQTPAQYLATNFPSGGDMTNGFWRYEPDGNGGTWLKIWGKNTTGYGYGDGQTGWSGNYNLPKTFADPANVSCRAWPVDLNVTGLDSDEVVAQLVTASTFRLGSEDQQRSVYYEFYGKGA